MRHRMRGRKLGRNASHRKAMFRNMACSLIRSVRIYEDESGNPEPGQPKVEGRITTTLPKAKELRPIVEKLITLAKRARVHEEKAEPLNTTAARKSAEWETWRNGEGWQKWSAAIAPAVALRRRAFAELRDHEAVDILFDELAERFAERPGGYCRVVRLATVRLGDAGQQAIIEFVGTNDRVSTKRRGPAPVVTEPTSEPVREVDSEPEADEEATTEEEAATEETSTDEATSEEASTEESTEEAASDESSEEAGEKE